MAIGIVTNESSIALVEEVTEGTFVAPSSGTDYAEVLSEGLELNKTRELLERDNLSSTVESEAARVGVAEVQGAIPVEFKASVIEGDAPQSLDVLLKSLLGGKRQITSDQTSGAGHSSTVITFADTSAFAVNDVVLVKEAGAYECRPIVSIQANVSITLAFALDNGAPSDTVVIAQVTTYYSDTASAPTFSAEHNLGSQAIKQKATGLRAASMSLDNYSVGQLASCNFSVQGLDIERLDEDALFAPDFSADALPPVVLDACLWLDGVKMSYTEFGMNVENTVNYIQDACEVSGKLGSRITGQNTTVSINPYMQDDNLANTWDKFNDNSDVSVFTYAFNPGTTDGEFSEVVACWLPFGKIVADPVADTDGIVSESIEVKCHKSLGSDSVFICFS